MIVRDAPIVASLTDSSRGIIYDRHIFILQATVWSHLFDSTPTVGKRLTCKYKNRVKKWSQQVNALAYDSTI